jgi:hypothetical protein
MPSILSSEAMLRPIGPMPTITAHWPLRSRGERSANRGSQAWRRWASASSGKRRLTAITAPKTLCDTVTAVAPEAVVTLTPRSRSSR